VQLSLRCGHRIYDRSITGLGTGKAHRYFASDFGQLSSRLFGANGIAAVEWQVASSTAVLHALSEYSNAVLDLEKSDEGDLHENSQNCSN
jgi:hypothetical protein